MTRSIIAILFVIFGLQTVNAQRLFPKQKGVETFVVFPIRALGNDFSMEDFSTGFGYPSMLKTEITNDWLWNTIFCIIPTKMRKSPHKPIF